LSNRSSPKLGSSGIESVMDEQAELKHLRWQVDQLQRDNTRLINENRSLRGGSHSILHGQVRAFKWAFDQPVRDKPTIPDDVSEIRLAAKLVMEEAFEFVEACCAEIDLDAFCFMKKEALDLIVDPERMRVDVDLISAVDALADLAYVTEGAWMTFGVDPQPVIDEVHRANMTKVGGKKDAEGKQQKPEGWKPPDIEGVLRAQGWKP